MKKITILLLLITGVRVWAQSNTSIIQSSQDFGFLKAVMPSTINYFSDFMGPSLNGDNYDLDSEGNDDTRDIMTWNQVSFQWNLTENGSSRFIFNPRFIINHSESSENRFDPESPVLGYAGNYRDGKFSANYTINTIVPFMRDRDMLNERIVFNPGGFNSINYQFSEAVSASMWIWYRMNFYEGRQDEQSDSRLSSFLAPMLNININDRAGSFSFFYWINQRVYQKDVEFLKNDNFNVMYTYTLNKYLTVQPQIKLFRANQFDIDKAQFNFWLSGRLF